MILVAVLTDITKGMVDAMMMMGIAIGIPMVVGSCITARRRRRQGMNPYRGTGWAAGRTPAGHAPAQYTGAPQPYYQQSNNAAPAYAPPNQGYYGHDSNQGYFGGGQQNSVELQPSFPSNTYQPQRGGDNAYSPPPGPPPGKQNDGIVR
ncbi:MAG: hypothetical protein Q9191_001129 [Dirinaria sp. TL-2023a]